MNEKEILQKTIDTFGEESQMRMCQEECAGLIQAINKYLRGNEEYELNHLIEELVDVSIMIKFMIIMILTESKSAGKHYEDAYFIKLKRLEQRIVF